MSLLTELRTKLASEAGAFILLGASLLFLLLALAPLARQVDSQTRAIAAQEAATAEPSGGSTSRRFLHSLPDPTRREKDISRLTEAAREHGLTVGQISVDDPAASDNSRPLSSQTGKIVVEGSYGAIRQWLADTMKASPGLAISALQISPVPNREPIRVARLDFIFFASTTGGGRPNDRLASPAPATAQASPEIDPFSWPAPRQTAVRRAEPAPEPIATLPYTYGGSLRSAGADIYLLIEGEQVIRVRIGDTLPGGQFRLDGATVGQLELIHLPSKQSFHLSIGKQ